MKAVGYLLDTMVLSELRKSKPAPAVLRWLRAQTASQLFISVVSIGEIERGIEKIAKADALFADELFSWLETLLMVYGEQILPVCVPIARCWGKLAVKVGNDGADVLIAATAVTHGLTVVTRNVKHFIPCGIDVINPFE